MTYMLPVTREVIPVPLIKALLRNGSAKVSSTTEKKRLKRRMMQRRHKFLK